MEEIRKYLWREFTFSTLPKYYRYFEEWLGNLTDDQLKYYRAYARGAKTPYDE